MEKLARQLQGQQQQQQQQWPLIKKKNLHRTIFADQVRALLSPLASSLINNKPQTCSGCGDVSEGARQRRHCWVLESDWREKSAEKLLCDFSDQEPGVSVIWGECVSAALCFAWCFIFLLINVLIDWLSNQLAGADKMYWSPSLSITRTGWRYS